MEFGIQTFQSLKERIEAAFRPTLPPAAVDVENPPAAPPLDHSHRQEFNLSGAVLGFCFASVPCLLMLFFQRDGQLPLLVYIYALAIVCAFAAIYGAKFVRRRRPRLSKALKRVGYASAALGFFVGITMVSPLWLAVISWFIFAIIAGCSCF